VFQQSALQVVLELLAHESGQVTSGMFNHFQEFGVMLRDKRDQGRPLRAMPAVNGGVCGYRWPNLHYFQMALNT
jgi:hypothetical protein